METRIGYGIKKANRTDLDLDFQLNFNETARSFIVTLEYQPYAIYKPRITLTDLGVGLASLGLLGKVFYDNWDHDNTFTFTDDTFDWYEFPTVGESRADRSADRHLTLLGLFISVRPESDKTLQSSRSSHTLIVLSFRTTVALAETTRR